MDTFKKIQNIVAEKLQIPPQSILPESTAAELSGWDSVNHIMIISDIEEAFDFKFRLEEIGEMDSVQKLIQAVNGRSST